MGERSSTPSGWYLHETGTMPEGRTASSPQQIPEQIPLSPWGNHGGGPIATGVGPETRQGGPRRARSHPLTTARRVRRVLLGVTAAGVVVALVGGALVYRHLNANLRSASLYAGVEGDAGKEKSDARGRTPLNILVIGSDTRATAEDCRLGGGCEGGGANADVQMVVHVAADRSNATVMSIPRDTVTHLPSCVRPNGSRTAARDGQINSTLGNGPGCTVAAVHKLTGIPIDHFVMVDFAGVIAMSDATGGASVCVTDNVYDTYSQLKLAKGRHTLKGLAALQFVRSRHGFGDGSDLGRTYAQHIFLSAVIRNMKSAGTLANPQKLYGLANAATKALTVDKGLASIPSLIALAVEINKVPTDRITFTTMQNQADPANPNRVIPAPAAKALFTSIIDDQSLSTAKPAPAAPTPTTTSAPAPSATPTAAPSTPAATPPTPPTPAAVVARSAVAVTVVNGSGRTGRAVAVARTLTAQGFNRRTTSSPTTTSAAATTLRYGPGQQAHAQTVAAALNLPATALRQTTKAGLTLVVGKDWSSGTTFPGKPSGTTLPGTPTTPAPAPASTKAALADAHAQTADESGACAQVSTLATSLYMGVPMSPSRAYAVSKEVKDSAP